MQDTGQESGMQDETLAFPGLTLSTCMQLHATHTREPALGDTKNPRCHQLSLSAPEHGHRDRVGQRGVPSSGMPTRAHRGEMTWSGIGWPDTSSEGQGRGRHLSEVVSGLIKL